MANAKTLNPVIIYKNAAALLFCITFASFDLHAASIRYSMNCSEVFSSSKQIQARAVHLGRQMFATLARQLRSQELRADVISRRMDVEELDAVDSFNQRVGLPPSKAKILEVKLDTYLDEEIQSLHYGLRGLPNQKRSENSRFEVLNRLDNLVSEFGEIQDQVSSGDINKKRKQLASVFVGREEIARFIELYKKQIRSVRKLNIANGLQSEVQADDSSVWEALRARYPVASALVTELTTIWTIGSLIAPSMDAMINDTIRPYTGFDVPNVSQGLATLYAFGDAIRTKLSEKPGAILEKEGLIDPIRPATAFNNPFVRYLRGLNNVAQGRWQLKDREFWYLATEYSRKPEKGEDIDDSDPHHLDLVLFQDDLAKQPTLVVFRR